MTDPLDALRAPVEPVDPDPHFAERLRQRLREALLTGEPMTTTQETEPAWPPSLTPYIVVSDARAAMDWYVDVFGATRRGEIYVNDDGTVGHAEIGVGNAVLMFAEASELWPDVPVAPPAEASAGTPVKHSHTLHLQVSDVDGTTRRAAERGASVEREPRDQPYGRGSVIVDPFGHRWILLRPPGRATRHRHGDISYVTMVVADDERAKAFYGAVFGWEWEAGSVPNAWGPVGHAGEEFGIWGDRSQRPEVQLCYRVDDIEAALTRVRASGGQAGAMERKPYGLMADCVDDLGAHFQLWQPID
jgi:predicted enzyme related to lactoylglutathione lyase